jgi:hypothetical protein
MNEKKGIDLFGIKPIAEAVNVTVAKSFEGIEGFLKIVCVPALEEVGFLLRDKVSHWRLNNVLKILKKAQDKLEFENGQLQIKAHPRVALSIIENGSLNDNDDIQNLWAGLFVSSCTKDGQDDENLIFVDLLKQLTIIEAKILNYACIQARKVHHKNGLFTATGLIITSEELSEITGIYDIHRLDRELDHLKSLNLIGTSLSGGFKYDKDQLIANIPPTALALNLYLKSQGYNGEPQNYWIENIISHDEYLKEAAIIQDNEINELINKANYKKER